MPEFDTLFPADMDIRTEQEQTILRRLQNHMDLRAHEKWTNRNVQDLRHVSIDGTKATITMLEKAIILPHAEIIKKGIGVQYKKSWRKEDKGDTVSVVMGSGDQIRRQTFVKNSNH